MDKPVAVYKVHDIKKDTVFKITIDQLTKAIRFLPLINIYHFARKGNSDDNIEKYIRKANFKHIL